MGATSQFFNVGNNANASTFDIILNVIIQNSPTENMKIRGGLHVHGDLRVNLMRANGADQVYIDDNCTVGLNLTVNGNFRYIKRGYENIK